MLLSLKRKKKTQKQTTQIKVLRAPKPQDLKERPEMEVISLAFWEGMIYDPYVRSEGPGSILGSLSCNSWAFQGHHSDSGCLHYVYLGENY